MSETQRKEKNRLSLRLCKLIGQLGFEKFASRSLRNLTYEANGLGTFVISKPRTTKRNYLFFRCFPTLFQDDKGCYFLSVELIRHSNRRGGRHRGMLIDYFVDFTWINVFSTTNNHVALAIDNIE